MSKSRAVQRWIAAFALLTTLVSMSGCAAAAPVAAAAVRVVMQIGVQVLISVGAEYVKELISPDSTVSATPVVRISYHNAEGVGVTTAYQVEQVKAISVSALDGDVLLSGNGRLRTVTVLPGSSATIEILPAGDGANIDVQVQAAAPTGPTTIPAIVATVYVTVPGGGGHAEPPPPQNPPDPDPPVPPEPKPPQITSTWTYVESQLVLAAVTYWDENGNAEGFGFRGVNGSGWAEESHSFTNPSYGRISPNRVDYPFNHLCGTGSDVESDVEFWIYDSSGLRSTSVVMHLACA